MPWIDDLFEEFPDLEDHRELIENPPTVDEALAAWPEIEGDSDLLRRAHQFLKHDGNGHGITRLANYAIARRRGTGHKLAVSMAMQQASATETSDSFWSGRPSWVSLYGEDYANSVRTELAKRGVNMGANDVYEPQLARFKGDPRAVLPRGGVRDHIRDIANTMGVEAHGAVKTKARGPEKDPFEDAPRLAESLVRERMSQAVAANPDLKRMDRRDLRESIIEKHGAPK